MDKPIIIDAWQGKKTDVTPIWLMRQAGRYLPEYREIRAQAGSFLDLCHNPDLAMEVTLQPLRRFDLDAAIIFSDILVIPQAMGQNLSFAEGEGPKLAKVDFKTLKSDDDLFELNLQGIYTVIEHTRAHLPIDKALIGFAGGPFTLACYMIDGGAVDGFPKTHAMMQDDASGFAALMEKLTYGVIRHLKAQIAAGCDAVQVFESHAGQLAGVDFATHIVRPMRAIAQAIGGEVPVIGFARGAAQDDLLRYAVDTGIDVAGIDQHTDIAWAADNIPPRVVLQGNLDPVLLREGNEAMDRAIRRILDVTKTRAFVFNLGHGVIKDTDPAHVARLVETVHEWRP